MSPLSPFIASTSKIRRNSIDAARAQKLLRPNERGQVTISFDHGARSAFIRDNGTGIAAQDALPLLLAVGASPKRGSDARGFRGVGRLSGLAYCRELQFRTKAAGERNLITVTWDCRALRERAQPIPPSKNCLRRIISDVVTVRYEKADDPAAHFFTRSPHARHCKTAK